MLPIIFDIGGGSGVWPVEMDCCGRIAPGEARGRGGGPMSCEARRDDEVEVGREDDAMLTGAAGTEFRSGAMLFVLRLVSSSLVDGVKVSGAELDACRSYRMQYNSSLCEDQGLLLSMLRFAAMMTVVLFI